MSNGLVHTDAHLSLPVAGLLLLLRSELKERGVRALAFIAQRLDRALSG